MLRIINKKSIFIFLCAVFVSLLLIVFITRIFSRQPSSTGTPFANPKTFPAPTYIPNPEVISDTQQDANFEILWELDNLILPSSSLFYSLTNEKITVEDSQNIAGLFGFTGTPQPIDPAAQIIAWDEGGHTLQLHIESRFVIFTSSRIRGKNDIDGSPQEAVNSDEKALEIADAFTGKIINNSNISFKLESISKITSEGELDPQDTTEDYSYQIFYTYQLGNYPVYLQRGNSRHIQVVIDKLGTVRKFQYWSLPTIPSQSEIDLVTFEELKTLIQNGAYKFTFNNIEDIKTPPPVTSIRITSGTIGYFFDFKSPYFYPSVVLNGEAATPNGTSQVTFTVPLFKNN